MRAAVVGLGWWGKVVVRSLKDSGTISVTRGVDLDAARLDNLAGEYGLTLTDDFDEVLKDPSIDAVIIAVPNAYHVPYTLKALEAGKAVFCEKPLALTVADAKKALDAARDAGQILGMGHERRWHRSLLEAKRRVDAGDIGKPLHVDTNFSHSIFEELDGTSWRFDPKQAPGAGFTGRGIHLTDFAVWMFGPAKSVWAHTSRQSDAAAPVDTLSVHITFQRGLTMQLGVLMTTPFYGRFTIYGEAGWVEAREPSSSSRNEPTELVYSDAKSRTETVKHEKVNTIAMNLEAWADAVEGRAPYLIKPEEILANIQIFEALVQSAERGEAVEIQPV